MNPFGERNEVLSETIWLIAGQLFTGLGSLLTVRALTFALPAGIYTQLVLLIGAIALLSGLVTAPFSNAANRYYYEMLRQDQQFQLLATGWLGLATAGSIGVALVLLFLPFALPILPWPQTLLIMLPFCCAVIIRFGHPLLNIVRRRREFAILAVLDVTAAPLTVVLFTSWLEPSWNSVVLGYAAGSVVSVLLTLIILTRHHLIPAYRSWQTASRPLLVRMWRFGWPTAVSALGIWVLSISDRYLLNSLLASQELVAYYTVAYQAGNLLPHLLGSAYIMLISPYMMRSYVPELGRVPDFQLWLGLFTWIAVPVFTFSLIFPERLVLLLAPEPYLVARAVVPYSCLGLLLLSFQQIAALGCLMRERTLIYASLMLLFGFVNIVMNLILIPRFGFMGAALSTVAAYGLQCVVSAGYARHLIGWKFPWKWLGLAVVAVGVSAPTTLAIRANLDFLNATWPGALTLMTFFGVCYIAVLGLGLLLSKDRLSFAIPASFQAGLD